MNRWKRMVPLCLAAAVTAAAPIQTLAGSPEFARTAEEWSQLRDNTMDYGELAGLIQEYNASVLNNQLDYNKKRADGDLTSNEIAQTYRDQASDLRSSISGDSNLADAMAEAQARQLEQQADNHVTDIETYKMSYDQTAANLVVMAQANMITYQQKLLQIPVEEKNRETLEAVYNSVAAKKNVGMATQMDVLTAQKNLQDADASLQKIKAETQKVKQSLCVMLGWRYDASPEIPDVPSADLNRISEMNPQNDKEKALANNYTLRINRKKFTNATTESVKATLTNTIKDNDQKIGSDLALKYQSVLQLQTSYDQAVSDFNLAAQNMQAAESKFGLGTLSRLDYQMEQNTYMAKQLAVKTADLSLFQAMETYDWAVNGLASVE